MEIQWRISWIGAHEYFVLGESGVGPLLLMLKEAEWSEA
jgi:hypothetical protein